MSKLMMKMAIFAALMAVNLFAQTFTEEAILATGLPVIKIETENRSRRCVESIEELAEQQDFVA